jgi:energy-coupling factor transporter ATP-binding protein EcfA2
MFQVMTTYIADLHKLIPINYAKFKKVTDDLHQKFIFDVNKYSEKSKQFKILNTILTTTNKKLKVNLKFFQMINHENPVYIVMINANDDTILMELAKQYNFPRGCPIVWIPEEKIMFNGFYSKFKNDDGIGSDFVNDFKEIKDFIVTGININEKISGFLCHIIGFKLDNKYYWTLCSKKSADSVDSIYINMAYEIISKNMTFELVKKLANGLYLGCEILHPNDNTHGYVTKNKTFVITCVGFGFSNNDFNDDKNLMSYYNEVDMHSFCIKNNLACGVQYSFTGENKNYLGLLELFFQDRDLMTAVTIEERIPNIIDWVEKNDIIFTKKLGTYNHEKDINEIMEGCIVFITYITPTGEIKKKIFKAKFGYYVINTMFFRDNIERMLKGSPLRSAESFVKFWITPKYYEYFIQLCNMGMKYIETITLEHDKVYHIQMAEYARTNVPIISNDIKINKKKKLICIIGPIGSGKTSYMTELAKLIPNSKPIDGDKVLFLQDENITQKLSNLRNPATMSLIYQALTEGKIPIISFGGGVFIGGKDKNIEVKKWLNDVFGYNIDFEFEIFYCTSKVKTITKCSKEEFNNYIDPGTNINEIVKNRLIRGEWKLESKKETEFIQDIIQRSSDNAIKIAPKFLTLVQKEIYLLPSVITPSEVSEYLSSHIEEINSLFVCNDKESLTFTPNRVYAIFKVADSYLHTTQYYGDGITIIPSCNLVSGDKLVGCMYSTQLQCTPPLNKPKTCKVIDFNSDLIKTDRRTHITITMNGLPNKDSIQIIEKWDCIETLKIKLKDVEFFHVPGKDSATPIEITFCGVIAMGHGE